MALSDLVLHQDFKLASLASAAVVGNTATFARGDQNASFVNSSGDLVFVGANGTPRLQSYVGGANKGLLVEGSRQNVCLGSDDIATSPWTANASNAVVSDTAITAPDGSGVLEEIDQVDVGGLWLQNSAAFAADVRHEPSFYARSIADTGVVRISNPQTSGKGRWLVDLTFVPTGSTERITRDHAALTVSAEFLSSGVNGGFVLDDNQLFDGPHKLNMWGVMLETGPSGAVCTFSSSYIKTTSAAVTRLAETCNIAHALSSSLGYTVVVIGRTPLGQGADDQILWEHHDGSTDDSYEVLRATADGNLHVVFRRAGVEVEDLDCGALADDTDFVLAFAATDGDFRASLDGGAIIDNGVLDDAPTGLTTVEAGHDQADANHWFGHLTEALIYTGTPGNAFLQDPFTDVLTADDLLAGTPVLDTPALGQAHVLSAADLLTGAPTLGTPVLGTGGGSPVGDALFLMRRRRRH